MRSHLCSSACKAARVAVEHGRDHIFIVRHAVTAAAFAIALGVASPFPALGQGSEPRLLIPPPAPSAPTPPPSPLPSPSPTLPAPGAPGLGVGGTSPAPAGTPSASPAVARLDVRITQLEQDLRAVTGRLEDVSFQLRKLDDRLTKLAADMEYRLSQARPASTDAERPTAGTGRASQSTAGASPAPAQSAAVPRPPREQYAQAFSLLEKRSYDEAAAAFADFLKNNPDDPLADNARYWLGETYYARGDYGKAAEIFLDGYEKNKQSPKAPDILLKLGLSLAGLEKKQEACATFRELNRAFPNAPDAVKERAAQESKRLTCGG
jgi:tol-pal system protein YbgF